MLLENIDVVTYLTNPQPLWSYTLHLPSPHPHLPPSSPPTLLPCSDIYYNDVWELSGNLNGSESAGSCHVLWFTWLHFHGLINALAWGFVLPLGVLVARYYRKKDSKAWFWAHRILQVCVCMCACMRADVCVCACACIRAGMCVCGCAFTGCRECGLHMYVLTYVHVLRVRSVVLVGVWVWIFCLWEVCSLLKSYYILFVHTHTCVCTCVQTH